MNKIYQRIDWENYPSSATPLNEDNLNKMDYTIDKLDDRIVTHETTKLDTTTGNSLVKDVTFDETTGIFTIEKLSGSKITINTALEKISTNFHFNPTTQKLVLTLIDGTVQEIDLSALITQYEFLESDTITFEIDASGKVKSNIMNGSITGEKLEPNYLADVTLQANNAKTSADNAKTSEELAYQYAEEARESASQAQVNNATNITYDNSISGLSATNVKDALDEVAQGSDSAVKDGDGNVITETYVKKQGDATIQGDVIGKTPMGISVSLWDVSNAAGRVEEAIGETDKTKIGYSFPKSGSKYTMVGETITDGLKNATSEITEEVLKIEESVLSTVAECTASTNDTDIAGASALTELNDSLPLIQTGQVNISTTADDDGWRRAYVTFGKEFSSAPQVFCQHVGTNVSSKAVTVYPITTKGFTVGYYGASVEFSVSWLAIGR
jgi:hypothetical protein